MADNISAALSSVPSGIMTSAQYKAQQEAAAAAKGTKMGQTEFLTLFTTQLKNQDPLDPVKNEAFVAQLAQFSQLEATTAMRTSMDGLVSTLGNQRFYNAASLIGKTVAVPDGPVTVTDTSVSQGVFNLPAGANPDVTLGDDVAGVTSTSELRGSTFEATSFTNPTGSRGSRPVRNFLCPPPWSAKVCATDRTMLYCRAVFACSGSSSQTSSPATSVGIGRISPR